MSGRIQATTGILHGSILGSVLFKKTVNLKLPPKLPFENKTFKKLYLIICFYKHLYFFCDDRYDILKNTAEYYAKD